MGARKQKDRLTDKDRKFCAVLYPDADVWTFFCPKGWKFETG